MPRCHGDCFMHVTDFTAIVEQDQPLIELQPAVLGDVERAIGRHCASLIHDGDCLQLGIGALPDAVLACLGDKNDLGLHTEMFSDGAVDLIRAGEYQWTAQKCPSRQACSNLPDGDKAPV